jgi:hypothetical protein
MTKRATYNFEMNSGLKDSFTSFLIIQNSTIAEDNYKLLLAKASGKKSQYYQKRKGVKLIHLEGVN